jgi:hypothetical protein
LNNDSDLKGLSALVIALLRADKNEASLSYVKNAQTVLDWVIENRADKAGGYSEKRASNEKVTADNLWLYTAFTMLHEKTGNDRYLEAARSAETFVYSQRSEDGTYYLPGDGGKNLLSAEVQALAAVLLNDRTGIGKAAELVKEEGCYGPDNLTEGCSMEASALMALAYKNLGMEAEANAVLSALSRYQLNNGGIPEANAADMTDGFGRTYSNAVRTSVTSLFVLAMNGGLSSAASRND